MAGRWRRGQGRPTARSGRTPTGTARGPLAHATGAAWRAGQAGSPLGGRTGGRAGAVTPRLAQPGALTEAGPSRQPVGQCGGAGGGRAATGGARDAALAASSAGTGRPATTTARTRRAAGPGAGESRSVTRAHYLPPLTRRAKPGALTVSQGTRSARTAKACARASGAQRPGSPWARARRGQPVAHQQRTPAQRPGRACSSAGGRS
jgi:hypothetical protein